MISKTTVMLGAATCLAVTAGLFAPDVICGVQSRIDAGSEEVFETTQIAFEPASRGSVLPALWLLKESEMTYAMESGANLTEEEAASAAVEASVRLAEAGYGVSLAGSEPVVAPYLFVSQKNGSSGIIWGCEFESDDGETTAYAQVDDSTGKVVSLETTAGRLSSSLREDAVVKPTIDEMRSWVQAWAEYWGVGLALDPDVGPRRAEAYGDVDASGGAAATGNDEGYEGGPADENPAYDAAEAALAERVGAPSGLDGAAVASTESVDAPAADSFAEDIEKIVAENDLEGLIAYLDGLSAGVVASFEDDPALGLEIDWRVYLDDVALSEFWSMMPV